MSADLFGDKPLSAGSLNAPSSSSFSTGLIGSSPEYTKWYRVWERASLSDFKQEAVILPIAFLIILIHLWGMRYNKSIFRRWRSAHIPVLKSEFATVGVPTDPSETGVFDTSSADGSSLSEFFATSPNEYHTYATGRRNVGFVNIKVTLARRYNPLFHYGELFLSFFFDSFYPISDMMEAVAYPFDGREKQLTNVKAVEEQSGRAASIPKSTYEGCVWGIVRRDALQRLRTNQYDVSLTTAKAHKKLPDWVFALSESSEITERYLTPELVEAVTMAGNDLESLIISDQPTKRPTSPEDFKTPKRITLRVNLPRSNDYTHLLPLFRLFLRLPDFFVSLPPFPPAVQARLKQTRKEEVDKMEKEKLRAQLEEKNSARAAEKKAARDAKLRKLSAEEQAKVLEREKKRNMRKEAKQMVKSGMMKL